MAKSNQSSCENELEATSAILAIIYQGASAVDSAGPVQVINSALLSMRGYAELEIIGTQPEILMPVKFQKKPQTLRDSIFEVPESPLKGETELVGQKKNSKKFSVGARLGVLNFTGTRFGLVVVTDASKSEIIGNESSAAGGNKPYELRYLPAPFMEGTRSQRQ